VSMRDARRDMGAETTANVDEYIDVQGGLTSGLLFLWWRDGAGSYHKLTMACQVVGFMMNWLLWTFCKCWKISVCCSLTKIFCKCSQPCWHNIILAAMNIT